MATKNAFVIRGYIHDEQTSDGQVIEDMPADLFKQLVEENKLVREATAEEVKAAKANDGIVPRKAARVPENKAAPQHKDK